MYILRVVGKSLFTLEGKIAAGNEMGLRGKKFLKKKWIESLLLYGDLSLLVSRPREDDLSTN